MAKIVSNDDYIGANLDKLYPKYEETDQDITYFRDSSQYSRTTVLRIEADEFPTNVTFVLISVFAKEDYPTLHGFSIQLNQRKYLLSLNQPYTAFDIKGQFSQFLITVSPKTPSAVSIRSMGSEKCHQVYIEKLKDEGSQESSDYEPEII